ncbi:MAG: HD domain-containing protein [Mycoplasmatota bacterium]
MEKIETFNKEYTYFRNEKYVENIKKLVNILPDYFFEVPASSTGKYHPSYALNNGGLVRHTKAAVKIANDLLNNEAMGHSFNELEKDLILMALMLHDGLKSGMEKSEYTKFDHPLLVCQYIKDNQKITTLSDGEIKLICNMIESHMGQWNTNNYSNVTLPKPSNKYQRFVHMCDYLASRKYLEVPFNENNDIIE